MNNDPINLLERFFNGATSAEEERTLTEWLRNKSESDPELTEYYRSKWAATNGTMDSPDQSPHPRAYPRNDRRQRPRSSGTAPQAPRAPASVGRSGLHRRGGFRRMVQLRANLGPQGHLFEIYTEKGQKTNITLPDGTHVWLNSASKLSYDSRYNLHSREVNLVGEGYFEVAKDPERRFRVNTGNYTVEALGTAFNVKSYPGDRTSVTTLFEGKVRIDDGDGFTTTLDPMEAVAYDTVDGGFTKSGSGRTQFAGLWRNNELIVESGTTLEKLTELLDREYNIRFVFRSERIKQLRFEGIIKNNNLQNVLQLIGLSGEVSYTIEDNTVVLDEKR